MSRNRTPRHPTPLPVMIAVTLDRRSASFRVGEMLRHALFPRFVRRKRNPRSRS